ncbi:MAG: VWA domain-containing protein [Terracidiphilus sp.]
MSHSRVLLCVTILLALPQIQNSLAHSQQQIPPAPPTLRVTSTLVFLDITVLDKKGHPVVAGLTKNDFTITEGKKPQKIFSFEAPDVHVLSSNSGDENPDGKAPVTIFVLDQLNSSFEDFAFIRYEFRSFLQSQPALLAAPAELMVVRNRSMEMLQGFTRVRDDLERALDQLPAAIPYKWLSDQFVEERFQQSIQALQQIALQNSGVPGRKNIVWVGHGSPSFKTANMTPEVKLSLKQCMHTTANLLVNARASLFVIYPGLQIGHFVLLSAGPAMPPSAGDAESSIGDDGNPFADDINFGVFVNETGGELFYNRNDVDAEISRSQLLGSRYYTLTYQPHDVLPDGKFRRIRVAVRDQSYRAVTKAGYFAPDQDASVDPRQQTRIQLAEAIRSDIPFTALDLKIADVVRHPDAGTLQFTLLLKGKNLNWVPSGHSGSTADILVSAAGMSQDKVILASKLEDLTVAGATQDPVKLAEMVTPVSLTIRDSPKVRSVRVLVEAEPGGGFGVADLDREALEGTPAAPTPDPTFVPNRPAHIPVAKSSSQPQ